MSRREKRILIFGLVSVWVAVIFAPLAFHNFQPPPEVNTGLPMIIGALIALPNRRDRNGDNGRNADDRQREDELDGNG